MKDFFRSAGVQNAIAVLFSAWLKLCYATMRWTREGEDHVRAVWATPGGAILCFWHAAVPIAPYCWPQGPGRQDMRVLVSKSTDGEIIALTIQKIGFPSIRGSSKKATATDKNKHGEQAFRDMIRWVKSGGGMAITPDGPRGPAEVMQAGAPTLARMTGAPVIFCGFAAKPCIRARGWDRTIIPLPFSRGVMVWDGPHSVTRDDDLDTVSRDWATRLSALTRRAEAILDVAGAE